MNKASEAISAKQVRGLGTSHCDHNLMILMKLNPFGGGPFYVRRIVVN